MALKTLTAEQRQALAALRESIGGIGEEKRKAQKAFLSARKKISSLLAAQPATVLQIAGALNLPSHEVLWHVTGMRKYGQVTEAGEEGDYPLYALVSEQSQSAA